MLGQHFGMVEGYSHSGKGLGEHPSSQDDLVLDIQNMDGTQMETAQGLIIVTSK